MVTPKYADTLAADALGMVVMVRDDAPEVVGKHLADLPRTRVEHLVIALAAMVPDDAPLSDLLRWCDPDYTKRQNALELARLRRENVRELAPHGTHAAFNRHRTAGQEPCEACTLGERTYQRERARRRRAAS